MADGNAGFSIPGAYQPNILERVGAILQGQQDPIHKAQALDIEQKMGIARLNMQGRKDEEDRKLKQLKGFGDILKFYKEFADYIPEENKDALSEKIATDAKAAGFSISDPKTFRQFLNKADEFSGAIDILQQGLQSGKPIQDATIDALKNAKDPESRKLLGDALSKILAQKTTTGSFSDQVARELATDKTTGQIDPERAKNVIKEMRTNPQGLESRAADIIIKKNKGTATPEELSALEEMKGLVGGLAAQRGAGGEKGRLGVRSTPQYQQTEADVAGAKVTGRTEAGRKLPLGEKSASYIDPKTLVTAAPTMTEDEAMAKGYRAFRGTNAPQFLTSARSAFAVLDEFEQLSKKVLPEAEKGVGNIAVVAKSVASLQKRRAERDTDVVQFWALKKSALPLFARSMGDVANIAVAEQEFQATAMPNEYDTKQSAMAKISSRRKILEGVIKNALGAESPLPKSTGEKPPTGEIQIIRRRKVNP